MRGSNMSRGGARFAGQIAVLCLQSTGILYATREYPQRCVKSYLTLSPSFLILKDLRRNRLAGRLTRAEPAPTLDTYEEKDRTGRHRRRLRRGCSGSAQALIFEAETYLTDFCASQ